MSRTEWMKGICFLWSRGRHFSPLLPGNRYLKLGSQKRSPGRNLGEHRLVRRPGTTSRGTALLVLCLRMHSSPLSEFLTISAARYPRRTPGSLVCGQDLQCVKKLFEPLAVFKILQFRITIQFIKKFLQWWIERAQRENDSLVHFPPSWKFNTPDSFTRKRDLSCVCVVWIPTLQ